jgi:transposase
MEERLFLALGDGLAIEQVIVEGHVHRLKLIKRQGYGRATFPLLRKRVLTFH